MGTNSVRCLAGVVCGLLSGAALAVSPAAEGTKERAVEISFVPIVTKDLVQPLFLTHAGDRSGQLFVVEQGGRIRVIERGRLVDRPFLDIRELVSTKGQEQGLLGLAFHPQHERNGRFFVSYNRRDDGATVVAEYARHKLSLESGRSGRTILVVPQPYLNHNGGMIAFGPDRYLYIGRGDGGSRGDPQNRAQNPNELLGKLLRIDVDHGEPYAIPPDNPFITGGGRQEIYATGLRNPWRFSFDRETGALWLADVGQHKWEEIDRITKGGNYGWRLMEGFHCFNPEEDCAREGLAAPVAEYGHDGGRCSITGGYVYRGPSVPALRGWYVFGDYCSGEVMAVSTGPDQRAASSPHVLARTAFRIASFGEDERGDLYVVDHQGGLYRLSVAGS